jgi:hypothetical protein
MRNTESQHENRKMIIQPSVRSCSEPKPKFVELIDTAAEGDPQRRLRHAAWQAASVTAKAGAA